MADRTLRNPIIRNALLSWALSRLKRGGNPDEVREAIGDMDPSLTYDEALALIERASSLSYEPLSPNDPYRRVASQLDWSKVRPVQEEQIEREELLMNAEVIRRALEEGIISESEAQLYLEPPESREEIERLREEIMRLQQQLREREEGERKREEERRRREMVDRVMNYITQRAIQFNLSPQEANRLRGEVNPNLSYDENLQLVENSIAEILREREAQEAQRQIQRARQQPTATPTTTPTPTPTPPPTPTQRTQPEQQPTPEQVRAELSRMGSRRLRDLGTALLAKDVEQGLTPLEKEMLNAILRILEERGENVGRMIHEQLIQGFRWSVRTYYGNEVAYSNFESREDAEKLAEKLRKAGIRAEVVPYRREYSE
jgi:hypothetical protein